MRKLFPFRNATAACEKLLTALHQRALHTVRSYGAEATARSLVKQESASASQFVGDLNDGARLLTGLEMLGREAV